jgi:SPP1 family predicted phage head-tail adaptor
MVRARTTASDLTELVELQKADDTSPDGGGGVARSWSTTKRVWAAIQPLSATQRFLQDGEKHVRTHRITVRADPLIEAGTTRLRLGSRIFEVDGDLDPLERGEFVQILSREYAETT